MKNYFLLFGLHIFMSCYASDSDTDSTRTQPAQISDIELTATREPIADANNGAYHFGGMVNNSLSAANFTIALQLPAINSQASHNGQYYQNNREARRNYHGRGWDHIFSMCLCCIEFQPPYRHSIPCNKCYEVYCDNCSKARSYCHERCSNCKETYNDYCELDFCSQCCHCNLCLRQTE